MANEKRLIDANALVNAIWDIEVIDYAKTSAEFIEEFDRFLYSIRGLIATAPTVDAVEVVHGRWRIETDEEEPHPMFKLVVCSACKEKANNTYNYCPNCGAKMDGDGNV